MKTFRQLTILFIVAAFFTACHKDVDTGDNVELLTTFTPVVLKEVNSTIVGTVVDEKNTPVEGAVVQFYNGETKTNKHGIFVFNNVLTNQHGTYIRVQKQGYIMGSDMVFPLEKSTNLSRIKLMSLEQNNLLDSKLGGNVPIEGGGKISFEPASIQTKDKVNFEGTVFVTAKYISPSSPDINELMPGGLIADAANGNTVVLGTLGMVAVELRDDKGNELFLNPTKKAKIFFPVNTSYKPASIPLWSFDENKGWWKEEGVAKLEGDFYIGEVSHFSFWNCDAPFPLISLCGKVTSDNDQPLAYVQVKVEVEGIGAGYGYVNSNGEFIGKVPKGKVLKITFSTLSDCEEYKKTITVGPFENDVKLDPVTLPGVKRTLATGILKCSGVPVQNGVAVLKIGTVIIPAIVDNDGKFSIDYSQFVCENNLNQISIFGYENTNGNTSSVISLTPSTSTDLIIDVCTISCDFVASLDINCDNAIVNVTGGSGNFKYEWQGYPDITTSTFPLSLLKDSISGQPANSLCVMITDLSATGCTKPLCKTAFGLIEIYGQVFCDNFNGQINIFSNYPANTVSYLWSNGSTTQNPINLAAGNYCVTVTNAQGCAASKCFDVMPVEFFGAGNCNGPSFALNTTPFNQGEIFANGLSFPITFGGTLDVFMTGYQFGGYLRNDQCGTEFQVILPNFPEGLQNITATATSCGTCSDGKISYNINSNGALCQNCQVGPVKLYLKGNYNTDLISNINGNLAKGEYFLVLTDNVTGCWVYHKAVKIQ